MFSEEFFCAIKSVFICKSATTRLCLKVNPSHSIKWVAVQCTHIRMHFPEMCLKKVFLQKICKKLSVVLNKVHVAALCKKTVVVALGTP